MKPDKIYSIFRKVPRISLFNKLNEDGDISKQYISNGVIAYSLDGLPEFSEYTLPSLIGFDKKQEVIVDEDIAPEWFMRIMSEEGCESDIVLKAEDYEFFDCIVMRSFDDDDEQVLHFVDPVYIKPWLGDTYITFISRVTSDGTRCILVKDGFFVQAAIMTKNLSRSGYIDIAARVHQELIRQKKADDDKYEQVGEKE